MTAAKNGVFTDKLDILSSGTGLSLLDVTCIAMRAITKQSARLWVDGSEVRSGNIGKFWSIEKQLV